MGGCGGGGCSAQGGWVRSKGRGVLKQRSLTTLERKQRIVSNTEALVTQPCHCKVMVWAVAEKRKDGENKQDRGVIQQL